MSKKNVIAALVIGLAWTGLMILFGWAGEDGLTPRVFAVTLARGLGLGFFLEFVNNYFRRRLYNKIVVDLADDEHLVMESPANTLVGRAMIVGKLFLTNKRLVFRDHRSDAPDVNFQFRLGEIEKLHSAKKLFSERVLTLEFKEGETRAFFLDNPRVWIDTITHQKHDLGSYQSSSAV